MMGFIKLLSASLCIVSVSFVDSREVSPQLKLAELSGYASPGEFPFQVSIQFSGQHVCGGSLISKTHVLTAGHCFFHQVKLKDKFFLSRVVVEVGSIYIGKGKTHKISKVSQKKDFNLNHSGPFLIPNDVAIITLKEAIIPSAHVGIIPLPPESHELPTGVYVTVLGFGNEKSGGPTSMRLRKSFMRILTLGECNNYWTGRTILPSQICASWGHGYGTCQGDSGGPLIHNDHIVGIVSAGDNMCDSGSPDIYTKVSRHISFIKSCMAGHNHEDISLSVDDSSDYYKSPSTESTPPKQIKQQSSSRGHFNHSVNSVIHPNSWNRYWKSPKSDSVQSNSSSSDPAKSPASQGQSSGTYPAFIITETSKYPVGWWRIALPKSLKKKPPSQLELHLARLRNLTLPSTTAIAPQTENMTVSPSDTIALQPENVTSL